MIVLDTNVISELMRRTPSRSVSDWIDLQSSGSLFITAVTEAEIGYGLALLPPGRRRDVLTDAAERAFRGLFGGRILPFDGEAAVLYATIAAESRAAGRGISQFDCQIAAIARARGAALATRNADDFVGCGLEIVNPWPNNRDGR